MQQIFQTGKNFNNWKSKRIKFRRVFNRLKLFAMKSLRPRNARRDDARSWSRFRFERITRPVRSTNKFAASRKFRILRKYFRRHRKDKQGNITVTQTPVACNTALASALVTTPLSQLFTSFNTHFRCLFRRRQVRCVFLAFHPSSDLSPSRTWGGHTPRRVEKIDFSIFSYSMTC